MSESSFKGSPISDWIAVNANAIHEHLCGSKVPFLFFLCLRLSSPSNFEINEWKIHYQVHKSMAVTTAAVGVAANRSVLVRVLHSPFLLLSLCSCAESEIQRHSVQFKFN